MIFNTQLPSSRLHADLNGLEHWAMMAPPDADECDWGCDHYAANVRSILRQLDQDFAELLQKNQQLQALLEEAATLRKDSTYRF